jgi:hypothetical protein
MTAGWPCKGDPGGRCQHETCKPPVEDTSEFNGYVLHTMDAAPDGITPDEWRRGIALIASASMHMPYGTSTANTIRDARTFEKWIREGVA